MKSLFSHLTTLELDKNGVPKPNSTIIGLERPREALGVIVKAIGEKRLSGRCVCIIGPKGSGKKTLEAAFKNEIGVGTPVVSLSSVELRSKELKPAAKINACGRRAMKLKIREIKTVYQGEVTDMKASVGILKTGEVILRASKGSKKIHLDEQLFDAVVKADICTGDIIYVEPASGIVKKLGRSESFSKNFDLDTEIFVQLPKGEVVKRKEVVHDLTLYDLDKAASHPNSHDLLSKIGQVIPMGLEVTDKLRREVNTLVEKFIDDGSAVLIPGVLCVSDIHLLEEKYIRYLLRCGEKTDFPFIVLFGDSEYGNGYLQRILVDVPIIILDRYTRDEVSKILALKLSEFGVEVEAGAFEKLVILAVQRGLEFVISRIVLLKEGSGLEDLFCVLTDSDLV